MRTTINLDADVLDAVKTLATQQRVPMGTVLSNLVRRGLKADAQPARTRNGILLFPTKGRTKRVTPELVRELLEESE